MAERTSEDVGHLGVAAMAIAGEDRTATCTTKPSCLCTICQTIPAGEYTTESKGRWHTNLSASTHGVENRQQAEKHTNSGLGTSQSTIDQGTHGRGQESDKSTSKPPETVSFFRKYGFVDEKPTPEDEGPQEFESHGVQQDFTTSSSSTTARSYFPETVTTTPARSIFEEDKKRTRYSHTSSKNTSYGSSLSFMRTSTRNTSTAVVDKPGEDDNSFKQPPSNLRTSTVETPPVNILSSTEEPARTSESNPDIISKCSWDIRLTKSKGRGMFATQDIEEKASIHTESSLVNTYDLPFFGEPWSYMKEQAHLLDEADKADIKCLLDNIRIDGPFSVFDREGMMTKPLDTTSIKHHHILIAKARSNGRKRQPNAKLEISGGGGGDQYKAKLSSLKPIEAQEEITIHYGMLGSNVIRDFFEVRELYAFKDCQCINCQALEEGNGGIAKVAAATKSTISTTRGNIRHMWKNIKNRIQGKVTERKMRSVDINFMPQPRKEPSPHQGWRTWMHRRQQEGSERSSTQPDD